jgi:hypothetical protein
MSRWNGCLTVAAIFFSCSVLNAEPIRFQISEFSSTSVAGNPNFSGRLTFPFPTLQNLSLADRNDRVSAGILWNLSEALATPPAGIARTRNVDGSQSVIDTMSFATVFRLTDLESGQSAMITFQGVAGVNWYRVAKTAPWGLTEDYAVLSGSGLREQTLGNTTYQLGVQQASARQSSLIVSAVPTPEPTTLALALLGLPIVAFTRRLRLSRAALSHRSFVPAC